MAYEHIIDPSLDLKERCRALKRLENALCRSDVLIRMQYQKGAKSICRFEAIEGEEIHALPSSEKTRLRNVVAPVVRRAVARFRAELFADACRLPDGYVYSNYWPPRNTRKSTSRKAGSEKDSGRSESSSSERSPFRMHFDTFDDCSSVWTSPSNWRKRDT